MTSQYDRYGDYIVDRRECLGSGTYGSVWRGFRLIRTREGDDVQLEPVAIKESAYDQKNIQEISTLQILTHPNIVRYIDYKISKDSLFLVMWLFRLFRLLGFVCWCVLVVGEGGLTTETDLELKAANKC